MTQETVQPKKRRGPLPTGKGTPVQVRMLQDQLAALDAWIATLEGPLSRPEAVRRLVEQALHRSHGEGESLSAVWAQLKSEWVSHNLEYEDPDEEARSIYREMLEAAVDERLMRSELDGLVEAECVREFKKRLKARQKGSKSEPK